MDTFQIPSHGAMLNAFVYIAAGVGPHPAVVLLHGFPGNERNLDLAQDMRRAGWDVLYFNYRGSWGSPGDFLSLIPSKIRRLPSLCCVIPRWPAG
jgi:pimeloyl-ACP methyl ester carboxylesterase